MTCPHCGSTDIADVLDDGHRICLDCNKLWCGCEDKGVSSRPSALEHFLAVSIYNYSGCKLTLKESTEVAKKTHQFLSTFHSHLLATTAVRKVP